MIRGTFLGLEIAKKGLFAARAGLDTTSHNVANSATEGYSRQRVNLRASSPLSYPGPFITLRPGQIGTGVEAYSITRIRSDFVEAQIHKEGGGKEMYTQQSEVFTRIEGIVGDPSDTALNGLMEHFFGAWEDLSNDPESASARTNLRESARALTDFVNEIDFNLKQEINNINELLYEKVNTLNGLAEQVAEVNDQIIQIEGSGQGNSLKANDLKDRRDLLVEQMSQLVNARVILSDNGGISVLVQGHPIVTGEFAHEIGMRPNPADPFRPIIEFTKSRIPLEINSGEIAGLMRMRDVEIPAVTEHLSQLITAFTNRVNDIHLGGYGLDGHTSRPFFIDNELRRVAGTLALPADTTLSTTLDELGISSGDFFIQGQHIVIEPKEVLPGQAITVGDLLGRIEDANIDIRAELDTSLGFPRIVISQFNPVSADTQLTLKDGSSNFFEVTGLDKAIMQDLQGEPPYQNALYNFKLNSTILSDLNAIAAAGDDGLGYPGPGDNRVALAIADLKNKNDALFNTSFGEFYQSAVATLGSVSETAKRSLNTQTLVVDQLEERRQEISGVNLDEEAVNLVRYQKAFEASARALTTIDETLDLIANRLGILGR